MQDWEFRLGIQLITYYVKSEYFIFKVLWGYFHNSKGAVTFKR